MSSSSSSNVCCGRVRIRLTCTNGIYTLTGTSTTGTQLSLDATTVHCSPFQLLFAGQLPIADCIPDAGIFAIDLSSEACFSSSSSSSSSGSGGGVLVPCCGDIEIPTILHGTFSNLTGLCVTCFPAINWILNFSGNTAIGWLSGLVDQPCDPGLRTRLIVTCDPTINTCIGWGASMDCGISMNLVTCNCDPFQLVYSFSITGAGQHNCCGLGSGQTGTGTLTVTA